MSNKMGRKRLTEMRFLRFSTETMLNMHLARHRRYVTNVDRTQIELPLDIPKVHGEVPLARVRTTDGRAIILTTVRVICENDQYVDYTHMVKCHWMSDSKPQCIKEARRMKEEHFDRLILQRGDGSNLVVDHLDQAVFPLLRFFEWQLLKAEAKRQGIM
jgi:hypothetical protein